MEPASIAAVMAATLLVNVPFGFWRAGVRKFSWRWFVAIHAPVPLIVGVRVLLGVPFRLVTVPLFVACYFTGQALGTRLWRSQQARA